MKRRYGTVQISNAAPFGRRYTSQKAAAGLVQRGRAAWILPGPSAIYIFPFAHAQRLSKEAREKVMEESIVGRNVGFQWKPKFSGPVRVMQAERYDIKAPHTLRAKQRSCEND